MKLRNHLGLGALLILLISGCCDGSVDISGQVTDNVSGAPIDSVKVNYYYSDNRQARLMGTDYSDSLGGFLYSDFGYCSSTRFFLVFSHTGYRSQTLDVSSFALDLDVQLERE